MKKIAIAIDGPAAAGKSTVAKIVAHKMNYKYIDTGAMYRAVTFYLLHNDVDVSNEEEITTILSDIQIEFKQKEDGQHIFLNGKDVTDDIRTDAVTNSVSKVSSYAAVRKEMVRRQQYFVKERGIVMDGRDIGTHVIPDAEVKFYLVASVDERAERRFIENEKRGYQTDLNQIKDEIRERDLQDMQRKVSPLVKANDAIEIDTTSYSIQQVADQMYEQIHKVVQSVQNSR